MLREITKSGDQRIIRGTHHLLTARSTDMNAFVTPAVTPRSRAKRSHGICSGRSPRVARAHKTARMCAPTATALESFLRAAGDLGTLRFIAISDGAVLETIGRLDYDYRGFTIPNKGRYLSIVSIDSTFECHINLSKVRNVSLSSEKAKLGDFQQHIIRLLGEHDNIVLSILLQWDPSQGQGHYLHGAEDAFTKLQQQFGSRFSV